MAGIKKEKSQLAKNIKAWRTCWGETQLDLAISIGLESASAITNYEKGDRVPDAATITKIARHYRVTEGDLVNRDFSFLQPIKGQMKFDDHSILSLFPTFSSEKALSNPSFKKAFDWMNGFWTKGLLDLNELDACIQLYKQARDEGIVEAAANQLSLIMCLGFCLSFSTEQMWEEYDYAKRKAQPPNIRDFLRKSGYLPSFLEEGWDETDEIVQEREKYNKLYYGEVVLSLVHLKFNKKFCMLSDYYLAMQYLSNMILNDESAEANWKIGIELLSTFRNMANPYAKALIEFNTEK